MEHYQLKGSMKTPTISMDPTTGVIEITGRSIPEDSLELYSPVIDWIDKYCENPLPQTQLNVQLDYFNTSSSKCLLEIFRRLDLIHPKHSSVNINWLYEEEDEDMLEAGEDYQAILNIKIKMVEVASS